MKIVIKILSNLYYVKDNENIITCRAKGIFRNQDQDIKVGDIVQVDKENMITKIEKRKNSLIRPPISNVDQALIVVSATEPEFSTNLLDKMLTIIEFNNIVPIIFITKTDLVKNMKDLNIELDYYKKIGYKIFTYENLEEFKTELNNKITVLTGQSGVGKSTLLNKVFNFNLKTDKISAALKRGKQTTRHVELLQIENALIADTPGFSALNLDDLKCEDIRDNFIEFNDYKEKCKYKDCMHIKEDQCFIKELVEKNEINKTRYENYVKFINQRR